VTEEAELISPTPGRTKYRVFKANIMDDDGNKVGDGAVVELTKATAKHYSRLGYLKPFFDDEGEEDEDADELDGGVGKQTATQLARSRRASAKSASS
jgi:hypothetical protein